MRLRSLATGSRNACRWDSRSLAAKASQCRGCLRQRCFAQLPVGRAPNADANVGLIALTVSRLAAGDCPQPLHSRLSTSRVLA